MNKAENILFTIGHSSHSADEFVGPLREHDLLLVVDLRSYPYIRLMS
jgi:hypothetical protein